MTAMTIYGVTWPQDGTAGVARKPVGWWPPIFSERELLAEWSTPTFLVEGAMADLQPNDAGVKMCSTKMRNIIEEQRAKSDRIEWLPVHIECGGVVHDYAIPHLLDEIDVVDRERSVLNPSTGGVVKAHLRAEAIDDHRVFTYSSATGVIILFTEEVYGALRSCSGCSFLKIKASFPEARA